MSILMEKKIESLRKSQKYGCWYIVKQDLSFVSLCYQTSILQKFKNDKNTSENLETYLKKEAETLNVSKNIKISTTHRALRGAVFLGLIKMTGKKFETAEISDTFVQITERCKGKYEEKEKYIDIIERQIEKVFISSEIDQEYMTVRGEFRLYAVFLLYKILIELGRKTGKYSITMNEYSYLVATTYNYQDFMETLTLINILRETTKYNQQLNKFKNKFDNRFIQLLKQLPLIEITEENISIKDSYINKVAEKVYLFEKKNKFYIMNNYIDFLCSTDNILCDNTFNVETTIACGLNTILYGPPGTGKTFSINEYKEKLFCKNDDNFKLVTFHQSYGYEDFIEGIVAETEEGEISYRVKDGVFKEFCKHAMEKPEQNFLFVIDEINRGNMSKIFGELITLIEGTKRLGAAEELQVVLPYSGDIFGVPSNVYILGTMNTADRSIAMMDTALRRRFEFIEKMPDIKIIGDKVGTIENIDIAKILEIMNDRIKILFDREHTLGHAFFLNIETLVDLKDVFENKIIPLLQEYFFEDYEKIHAVFNDTEEIYIKKVRNDRQIFGREYFDLVNNYEDIRYEINTNVTLEKFQDFVQNIIKVGE